MWRLYLLPLLLMACDDPSPPTQQSREANAKSAAIRGAREALKDPESAQFRNVVAYPKTGGGYSVCGEVNARNGFGGYGGFERFAAAGSKVYIESAVGSDQFDEIAKIACRSNFNVPRAGKTKARTRKASPN